MLYSSTEMLNGMLHILLDRFPRWEVNFRGSEEGGGVRVSILEWSYTSRRYRDP